MFCTAFQPVLKHFFWRGNKCLLLHAHVVTFCTLLSLAFWFLPLESPRSISHRPSQQHFLCDIKLCLLTLTFNHDMDSFKLNKHAKYLDQKLCHSKVTILHTQIDIHTNKHTHPPHIRPTGCFFRTITFVVNIGCTKTQRFVTSILIFVAVVYRVSGLCSTINL